MNTTNSTRLLLLFCFPLSLAAQVNHNPPIQQVLNNQNSNVNIQTNVNSNNENIFVIQTTVTGIEISENQSDGKQQFSNPQVNSPQHNIQHYSSVGGSTFTGKAHSGNNLQKSKIKLDKRIKRFFNRHNKRNRSTNRCFSWR